MLLASAFVGCATGASSAVPIASEPPAHRADSVGPTCEALRHFLNDYVVPPANPANWILVVEAEADTPAVIECLRSFPVTSHRPELEPDRVAYRDKVTGKSVAFFKARILKLTSSEAEVAVSQSSGGTNSLSSTVFLKCEGEAWLFVRAKVEAFG